MHLHFIGIGGTAMGSVAVACREMGHDVTGSDEAVYPPMSDVLQGAGITWREGYDGQALLDSRPDLVVVGNAISRGNVELEAVLDERLDFTSMAGLIGTMFISKNTSIVCSGTHGKTTTSSLTAWILEHSLRKPGFLIGGVPGNFSSGCRAVPSDVHDTRAGVFVSEGDEYDTAFFDKRSKFVHYRPTIAIINNIEFDHADIFKDLDAILWSFQQMIRIVPRSGVILANADDVNVLRAVANAPAPVETVGIADEADWRITNVTWDASGVTTWDVVHHGIPYGSFALPMPGLHNIRNATMALAACSHVDVLASEAAAALRAYAPPKRRLELIGTFNGCEVIDDFAHHPTAIVATLSALRERYPNTTIHAVFEPRSNTTTRSFFQEELGSCFQGAGTVCIGPVNRPDRYAVSERLDTDRLKRDIEAHGATTHVIPPERATDPQWGREAMSWLSGVVTPGDVIAILSNGNVGGLRSMLVNA
ncbi:MAG: UDP-N-acetylmuramate:L-alanyl-gamma-D-glutamyl-meso-diaminopimelate ligase [Ignavibacteriae bacterium]|nr:MAG: UDP-N-acetylmuramate:L-alanyl-gamma-D-glutamyl-meso-diaminopimelate ligase [Ignavibacteriota bacterium]